MTMRITCENCFHNCRLDDGQTGLCHVWKNMAGTMECTNYGQISSIALDPIEKKPLYEFYPGTMILSIGSFGCNLRCGFCQNYSISQYSDANCRKMTADELTELAHRLKIEHDNIGVAYTYNEPLISYPYLMACMKKIRESGMVNVVVSNGTISPSILSELLPYIDAMNIDLKGFSEEIYSSLGGNLANVMENIRLAAQSCHVELTSLIVPGMNDGEDDMGRQAAWIASLDPEIPLHITRYFPRYHSTAPPTPIQTLKALKQRAKKHLRSVYLGNV